MATINGTLLFNSLWNLICQFNSSKCSPIIPDEVREHLTRDQRPFLHPEPLQIFRFTASPLQFTHSSSTGFRSENTWQEIRDHSFIQNHSRSSDSHLLFSSLTHLLQGSGQRTPDTRSETIPSSRITPDLQIHSFSSSVHSLIFYRVQIREHLTRDQRPFLHPESLQIFRFTSSLQFTHSSSTGFRSENTWHEIRDHSFIQNHSRPSDTQLLLFSSLTRLLQGSGQRTPDTRSETIPSSRITPDPSDSQLLLFSSLTRLLQGSGQRTPDSRSETIPSSRITPDLQIHSFFSSVHLTHLLQGSDQRTPDTRSETIPSSRITPDPSDSQLLLFSSLTRLLQGSGQRTPDSRSETIPSSRITPDLQIHSFMTVLLLFSSLTHLLQGSDQRTPDKRSETIPSSRITPDLQIHSFFSSVHSLIFYRVQIREHLTRDQRPFLHPESLQIFRFTASPLQFTHSSSTGFRSENTWHEIRDHSFIQNHSRPVRLTSSLQFTNSSSTGFRSENTWHEIRDHSFIQNHSRSSDSQLLLFSSLTHLLQGSGQRTPDTRSETIPSSRITPDLQIHSFSSSVHSLIFYRVQVREHLTRDLRPFLHPESLQIFRFTASPLQFTSLIFYRVQVREHLTRDLRPFLHPESLQIFRFTASSLQFTSLIFYRVQVREHLTRDLRPFLHPESLQIFRFTASSLQFTHLLQGSGQRTPDTRSETIPSSRITPDLQIHSFFSSVHSLIFYRVQVREHLTRDQRPFLHPESLQIFRFTASSLQFTHSSSTGFRSENTWHEIRDHSFIQNHSRPVRLTSSLQFTHSSSTGFRSENTWHEIRDHSFIQNHSRSSDSQLLLFSSPHSSSTGFRSEITWHEIRDHSFIQNHSRSSDSQLLLFSSLTHLLQGSGQRTPDTRSETIPSSRITPDLQIHSFSSSVHSLIFYRVQVREHLTRDQRPFLHPESLQIFRFTASSLQFTHSSSTGFRSENTWHEIRDHSFIQNHSRPVRLTSSLQFTHSSSTGFRSENTWHEIRDHSFIQNHSRSSDSQLLLFSSLTHLLQGSGQRTPDTRSETIPSSRITPDLQIHSFFSSVHSLIFYRVQIREHLTRDQRPFLHPESLQTRQINIFSSSVHSLIFYRVQIREHLTRDQRPFLHPESLQIFRFTASSLQFTHSSSTGFRSENTWHEIRDHSFIQNHSRLVRFTSSLQFTHSSSTGFRSENTWHEIRDHSFIQNHSRSSDSQLLLFSSLTHLLQGSGQRTPDTRSETIPSSRITPDLQINIFSSVHSLIFYRVQIREHLTRDQRPFLHPESLQIFRFTASSLQFTHSSSTGFRSENTWHEIRDHSFIQNHSRSSDSQLLLFSSLTHLLQGSGQRTPDTRSETIPSSRITPDLQIHSFSSSVHSLIFYRVQIREHLTRDQRPFLHPESLQIFRLTSSLQFTHLLQGSDQRTPDTRSETIPSSRITPDLQINIFSSVHLTHLLQGSDQRTPDTRSETIPSSRITPDLQIHSFSSSVHSLIFYRVQVREHLNRDQRPFLHPESLQIFRFTASPLQFTHSSSTGFRSENTWHEIRDHSFIQNHSRSSDSQLLLFSSLTHLLQGSDQRTPDKRSETIPSSRITPDPSDSQLLLFSSLTHLLQGSDQRTPDTRSETIPSSRITPDLQIHSFFSSVHLTHLLQGSDQRTPDTRSETIPSSRITPDLQIHSFSSSVHSLIFYRVQIRDHLTRDQRPFLHPESLQIFRLTSSLQFTHSSSTGFRSEDWTGQQKLGFVLSDPILCCFWGLCLD